jgi:hypothetical protein
MPLGDDMSQTWYSPTGVQITGTLETLKGRAHISGISSEGVPEHAGGTEIFYEEGRTVERDGKIVFLDDEGGEWTFDQLTSEPPEDGDETEVDDDAEDEDDEDVDDDAENE